jgi:RNA polymerase sigma-70 factor (ECF subfamily)
VVTDEQLLADYARALAAGHAHAGAGQQAFATLIGRYQQELFAFLYRTVSDSAAADDLFQETFIQVHRNAAGFDAQRKFRPWLFTIAVNKARDYLRSVNRRHLHSLDKATGAGDDPDGTTFVDLMDSGMEPAPVDLSRGEDITAVQKVLADMPAHYREVLVMSYFHQFAYKEMADMLHIPLGTVKSRLHAALAAFAKAYKAQEQEHE